MVLVIHPPWCFALFIAHGDLTGGSLPGRENIATERVHAVDLLIAGFAKGWAKLLLLAVAAENIHPHILVPAVNQADIPKIVFSRPIHIGFDLGGSAPGRAVKAEGDINGALGQINFLFLICGQIESAQTVRRSGAAAALAVNHNILLNHARI